MPDPLRSGPCVAVMAGDTTLLFDAGSGAARSLIEAGVGIGDIDAVFLTHFHSDHIDGLGELGMNRWVRAANQAPLLVHGAEGVEKIVDGFNAAYGPDASYRTAHHGDTVAPASGAGLEASAWELPREARARRIWLADGVSVQTFKVDHHPADPAVGYRIHYKGRTVVISGDTKHSENLRRYANNADILFHEALSTELVAMLGEAGEQAGDAVVAKVALDIQDYHTTPVEAAMIARDAPAKHLVFYHVVPALPLPGMEQIFLDGVDEVFPSYTLGVDGLLFSLPADSEEMEITQVGR